MDPALLELGERKLPSLEGEGVGPPQDGNATPTAIAVLPVAGGGVK
jgi:hypothetical protein